MSEPVAEYPCACCGFLVLEEPPGSYEICPICFWEDDLSQLRWVSMGGGANHASLLEAQANFASFGASEKRALALVRKPEGNDRLDEAWRRFELDRETVEAASAGEGAPWSSDVLAYCYWLEPKRDATRRPN